jgi:hypothetical protein
LQKQHEQFVAMRNGNESEVLAFYAEVGERWGHGSMQTASIDPEMPKFWNARVREKWPPAKESPEAPQSRYANWRPRPTGTGGGR